MRILSVSNTVKYNSTKNTKKLNKIKQLTTYRTEKRVKKIWRVVYFIMRYNNRPPKYFK